MINKNKIKAIFIDIDGTLTNSNKKLTDETIAAVTKVQNQNIEVVLCSGRTNTYVANMSKKCGASKYVISSNGGQIYDYKKGLNLYINSIPFNNIKEIWDYCEKEQMHLVINSTDIRYSNKYLYKKELTDIVIINNINRFKKEETAQLLVMSDNYIKMQQLEKYIIEHSNIKISNCSMCFLHPTFAENEAYFFDITLSTTDKGSGIKSFINYMNIKKEETIGFGDHINDKEMFEEVGYKVAMGNAYEKIKNIADNITLSNDDNGVAYFLNKEILSK